MSLTANLKQALGAERVHEPDEGWTDIGGDAIGTPLAVVFPDSTEAVVETVRLARADGTAIVPAGERTAYWSPLRTDGAIALNVGQIRGRKREDDVITVGAGEPVRELDSWLRAQGLALPVHPHAFGETTISAMVAMGLTSGIGTARGGIERWVTGLTVVTGAAEILRTGASSAFADTGAFMRDGMPDPTGLFIASEGTMGIITSVSFRAIPAPWVIHVEGLHSDPRALLRAAKDVCRAGVCDSFRALREYEPEPNAPVLSTPWRITVSVDSAVNENDARRRAEWVRDQLTASGLSGATLVTESAQERAGTLAERTPRWLGPVGSHTVFRDRDVLIGMEVNASYETTEHLLDLADRQAEDALKLSPNMVRTALYLAPGFATLGMHTSIPRENADDTAYQHRNEWLEALSAHAVVPYRLGHTWAPFMTSKIAPDRHALLRHFKNLFDPDSILNPHHPLVAP
jgi:FAD/FMN-containing dehydrogenase